MGKRGVKLVEQLSRWIWVDGNPQKDSYGEFYSEFRYDGGQAIIRISVDSNYVLYINGEFVNSGQYCDFPHYKVYDELNVTEWCREGINQLAIVVWYYGEECFTYYSGNAGLWFEIDIDGRQRAYSCEEVMSRYSNTFKNGYMKKITIMQGFSFFYDATKEDNWRQGELVGFSKSVIVEQDLNFYPRKTKKMEILPRANSKLIKSSKNYYLFDLMQEEVGYLAFKLHSKKKQLLTICWGEHIVDGVVRRKIGDLDFSVEIIVGEGITEYVNYFRRLGLRYLEIHSEDALDIEYATVKPCPYPLHFVNRKFTNPLHQRIYDVAVRTLHLCMHEHYEDCPWREQSLYVLDCRNQMLCGYYAFEEYEFARENLHLWGKDNRSDKLLSICAPTSFDLTIPSFSLHYIIAMYEYARYSGDVSLLKENFLKMQSIIELFEGQMEDGLVLNFTGERHWNFYEWSYDLEGYLFSETEAIAEAALNCFFSLALQNMQKICELLNVKGRYAEQAEQLNRAIRDAFYEEQSGLFVNNLVKHEKSELVNALAVLCGATKGEEAKKICAILAGENEITQITLSMSGFLYDALLLTDKEGYKDYIIKDIEKRYSYMLDAGATSFWETEKGEAEGGTGDGSLCHGWSAMPVYYFNILLQ